MRKRRSKWTYAELCERVKAIDERLFADKDAFIWNRIAFGTTWTKVYRKLINQGTEQDLNKQQTWLRTHEMSRVQLRNKWWHRTTYSATNKTFALASAERDSYQSCHHSRNAWDWSPKKSGYYFWVCTRNTPISLAFKKQNTHHTSQSGETLSDFLRKRALPSNTAVMKHQGLDSPRKPVGAMLISHPSTELSGAVPVPWSPQPC